MKRSSVVLACFALVLLLATAGLVAREVAQTGRITDEQFKTLVVIVTNTVTYRASFGRV
jgi:hypothetical protein